MCKPMLSSALASCSILLMVVWTLDTQRLALAGWSILMGLGACFLGGWQLLERERARVELVARLAAEAAVEHVTLNAVT